MRFQVVCEFFEACLTNSRTVACRDLFIAKWFQSHAAVIKSTDQLALLSTLLPHKRPDRVYGLQQAALEKVIGRALCLGVSQLSDLGLWRHAGKGDLGDCVERSTKHIGIATLSEARQVTVEEIEDALSRIASSSASDVKPLGYSISAMRPDEILRPLVARLQPQELKWFVRLVLKDLSPIDLPEDFITTLLHPLLPRILDVQSEFSAALKTLGHYLAQGPSDGSHEVLPLLCPQIDVKVGRQAFHKVRSIKHCENMAGSRRMSLERKYDGYYTQVHVDLSEKEGNQISFFSKRGKNCTHVRLGLLNSIRLSLRLGDSRCQIKRNCILEGEMVLFNGRSRTISDFHEIHKHIPSSALCAVLYPDEYLMIVFFDIMLLDDISILDQQQQQRRALLETIVVDIPGRAALADQTLIDFADASAAKKLQEVFARSIVRREEGLIMKPADDPYFSYGKSNFYRSCCIKMKKEYIGGSGEVGEFVAVAAGYSSSKAKSIPIPGLPWTDFYIGCLENKAAVQQNSEPARYRVIATVTPSVLVLRYLLRTLTWSESYEKGDASLYFDVGVAHKPAVVFPRPPVFEVYSFGFDKARDSDSWTLRFPQVSKAHPSRTIFDSVTFQELQAMAEIATNDADDQNGAQEIAWVRKLRASNVTPVPLEDDSSQCSVISARSVDGLSDSGSVSGPVRMESRLGFEGDSKETSSVNGGRSEFQRRRRWTAESYKLKNSSQKRLNIGSRMGDTRKPLSNILNPACSSRGTSAGLHKTSNNVIGHVSVRDPSKEREGFGLNLGFCNAISPKGNKTKWLAQGSLNKSGFRAFDQIVGKHSPDTIAHGGTHSLDELSQFAEDQKRSCPLKFCVFALSPCAAGSIGQESHIISQLGGSIVADPMVLLNTSRAPKHCKLTGTSIRKILLVDRARKAEMMKFLDSFRKLSPHCNSREPQWIEVFDLGILKAFARAEPSSFWSGPWKKYRVGAV